jgi:hypothetical protein
LNGFAGATAQVWHKFGKRAAATYKRNADEETAQREVTEVVAKKNHLYFFKPGIVKTKKTSCGTIKWHRMKFFMVDL